MVSNSGTRTSHHECKFQDLISLSTDLEVFNLFNFTLTLKKGILVPWSLVVHNAWDAHDLCAPHCTDYVSYGWIIGIYWCTWNRSCRCIRGGYSTQPEYCCFRYKYSQRAAYIKLVLQQAEYYSNLNAGPQSFQTATNRCNHVSPTTVTLLNSHWGLHISEGWLNVCLTH